MEFGSLRSKSRSQSTQQQKSRCRAFSTSNLSSVSCNSATLGRRSLCVTLPRDFGCDIGVDGRILRVKKGFPAHASGVVQVGDYVRVFDRHSKDEATLKNKSNSTNKARTDNITLHVTYGVLQVDSRPSCPLIIEIGNRSNTSLGIALTDAAENKIRISSVQPGSLADRCGFLKQGDILTSVHISSQETVPCSPYYTSYQIAQILRKLASQGSSITLTIFPYVDDENSNHQSQTSETSGSGSTLTLMDHEQRTYFNTFDRRNRRDIERLGNSKDDEEEDGDRCVLSLCLWKDRLYEDWGFSLVDQNENGDDTETEGEENASKPTDFLLKLRRMKNRVRGSFVYEIRRGGPAFMAGLKPGDRILQINDRDVSHLESTILVPILASLDDALNLVISRHQKPAD